MKPIILSLITCFILCMGHTAYSQAGSKQIPASHEITEPDLSTPVKAWQAFLEALKSGDHNRLRDMVTAHGFESMTKHDYSDSNPGPIYQRWYKIFSKLVTAWAKEEPDESIKLTAGPSHKPHIFIFVKTKQGWKMDEW